MEGLKEEGQVDVLVIAGGIIPDEDVSPLQQIGVKAVLGPGTKTSELVTFIKDEINSRRK